MVEIKQGSVDVPLALEPRLDGVIITVQEILDNYSAASATFTLQCETADKTDTLDLTGSPTTDTINFTLPEEMFDTAQRTWTCIMKMVFNTGITDYILYTFEVQVTTPTSSNTR